MEVLAVLSFVFVSQIFFLLGVSVIHLPCRSLLKRFGPGVLLGDWGVETQNIADYNNRDGCVPARLPTCAMVHG